MEIPEHLKLYHEEPEIRRWCIARYDLNSGQRCGPLGPGMDFGARGQGLEIMTFDTEAEAQARIDEYDERPTIAKDVPELVSDQCWIVVVIGSGGGHEILYEGNDFILMRQAYFQAVGRREVSGDRYMHIEHSDAGYHWHISNTIDRECKGRGVKTPWRRPFKVSTRADIHAGNDAYRKLLNDRVTAEGPRSGERRCCSG